MPQRQPPSFTLAPAFVVRIATVPIETLAELRFTRTYRLLARTLRLEDVLAQRAEALSVDLHEAIGLVAGLEHKYARQRLITLRRAIFQMKMPAERDQSVALLALLPVELAARVRRWLSGLQQLYRLRARLQTLLESELADKQTLLLQKIPGAESGFLAGLLLSSNDLYLDWQRWLAHPISPDRKLIDGIMNYLARGAAKTSPYSTFTSLARGQWVAEQPSALAYRPAVSWAYESVIEANYLLVRQLASALSALPQVRPHLMLRVNATLCMDEESWQFIARTAQGEEHLRRLKPTRTLREILKLVQAPAISYGAALQQLCALDAQGRALAIERFLDQLIEQGLLLLAFPIADQAPNYLAELLVFLRDRPGVLAPDILALFAQLRDHLSAYAHAPWSEAHLTEQRASILHQIQQTFALLFAHLSPANQLPAKNLFYETTLLLNLDLCCSRAAFPDITADLGLIQQLAGLYDPYLPGRLALAACFLTHYAPDASVGLLDFYARFCQQHRAASPEDQPNYAALAQQLFTNPYFIPENLLPALDALRALRLRMSHWLRSQPTNAHQERCLDRAALATLLADLPDFARTPLTLAYYCQAFLRDNQPWLVLNSVQSGFGRTLARFDYAAGTRSACWQQERWEHQGRLPGGQPLPVSIQGVFNSNINLRVDPLPYEIVYPGVVSQRGQEEQLPLQDLSVQYHAATGRLQIFSRRLQTSLLPAHMGMMSDYWLPPLYRFFVRAFSEAPIDPLMGLRLLDAQGREAARGTSGVVRYPRLVIGRTIVDRSHWLVAADAVPRRAKQETDLAYLGKIERWRTQYDIPSECFLRVNAFDLSKNSFSADGPGERNQLSKKRKPLPIDFQNYFLLRVFERQVAEGAYGFILEEALPASGEHLLASDNTSYTSEYVFELYQEVQP